MTQGFDREEMSAEEHAYWEGAASRQAEVDEYKLVAETLDDLYVKDIVKNKELQKRIDLCVSYIEDNHLNEKDLVLLVYGCLKGEQNEP